MDPVNEKSTQSNMASEVNASVKNSKFEKCKSRKRKSAKSLSSKLNKKQDFETSNKKAFRLLREALDALDSQNKEDEQVDIVLLPPPSQENGDTDNEMGDKNNLNEISLNQVNEVAGTVEVQTSKQLSKVKTPEARKRDKLNIRKKNKDYQSKVPKINDVMKSDISKDEKVNKLLKYSEKIELLHDWVLTDDNLGENSLKWNTICDRQQHEIFQNILEQCNRKLPVEIFELLFNHEIRSHIISETKRCINRT